MRTEFLEPNFRKDAVTESLSNALEHIKPRISPFQGMCEHLITNISQAVVFLCPRSKLHNRNIYYRSLYEIISYTLKDLPPKHLKGISKLLQMEVNKKADNSILF